MSGRLLAVLLLLAPIALADEPVFGTREAASYQTVLMGRVFIDLDADGSFGPADAGLAGARILVDEGIEAVCDEHGRYHLTGLEVGYDVLSAHLVVLDASSVPAGTRVASGRRKIVHLSPLGVETVDFPLTPISRQIETVGKLKLVESAEPLLRAGPSGVMALVKLASEPACEIQAPAGLTPLEDLGTVSVEIPLQAPLNQVLLVQNCKEQGFFIWSLTVHVVKRQSGGQLVVPQPPELIGKCSGLGNLRRRELGLVICQPEEHTTIAMGKEQLGQSTFLLSLSRDTANAEILVQRFGQTGKATAIWKNSSAGVSGLALGRMVFSFGGDGSKYISGGGLGRLDAWLDEDLKLILGINVYSLGKKGYNAIDVFLPARLATPWARSPDLETGFFIFSDHAGVIDANPSRSRYLVKLERYGSEVGYGAFRADFRGSGLGGWTRALHGAFISIDPLEQIQGRSSQDFSLRLEGFYSRPAEVENQLETGGPPLATVAAHDELLSTGGTLYLLAHPWVVEGSLKARVEIRDAKTGMTLSRRDLRAGVDFEVDNQAGRIILSEPLVQHYFGEPLYGDSPFSRSWTILVVDYERLGTEAQVGGGDLAGGSVRIDSMPAEGVRLRGDFGLVQQGLDERIYRRLGSTVSAEVGDLSLWAGYSRSAGLATPATFSADGGLWFAGQLTPDRQGGEAYQAGARYMNGWLEGQFQFRRWLSGYSDSGGWAVGDVTQGLLSLQAEPARWIKAHGRFSLSRQEHLDSFPDEESGTLGEGAVGFDFIPVAPLVLSFGGVVEGADGWYGGGKRLTASGRIGYAVWPWLSIFSGYQHTLLEGSRGVIEPSLTFVSAGGQMYRAPWRVGLEGGWGPEVGNLVSFDLGSEDEGVSTFSRTSFSPDAAFPGTLRLTSGQSAAAPYGATISTAQVVESSPAHQARGQRMGMGFQLGAGVHLALAYERCEMESAAEAGTSKRWLRQPWFDRGLLDISAPGRRNSVFGRLVWAKRRFVLEATGELRSDEQLTLPREQVGGPDHIRQVVFGLAGRWNITPELELGGRTTWSESTGGVGAPPAPGTIEARLLEASLGLAWRPNHVPWLWLLARLSAGEDGRPEELRAPTLPLRPAGWLSGTLAVDMKPWRYFQPALAVGPWMRRIEILEQDGYHLRWQRGLLGVLRLGSEIVWGLGLSGEARTAYSRAQIDPAAAVSGSEYTLGWAVELFYRIEAENLGQVRLGLGYNFSDMPDPVLQDPALGTGRRGFFIRLEGAL